MSQPWMDLVLDYAHDAGATVCWGKRTVATNGQLNAKYWVQIQMPDRVVEHIGPSLSSAAWGVMAELEPDPLDQVPLDKAA